MPSNRIKELREEKGITLQQLGNAVHLAPNTISQYETGKREPKLRTWQKLADYFGVSASYLQGIDANFFNYDLLVEENRKKNFSRYNEYALAHNLKVAPINRKQVNGWVTNITPPNTNELKVLVGLQNRFSFEEAQKLVADNKTKELIAESLPSLSTHFLPDDHLSNFIGQINNHKNLSKVDELPITSQSLIDMLCLVYQQYRGQVSPDFIKSKANLTTAKKKKILDDFSDLLEREITQDLDK